MVISTPFFRPRPAEPIPYRFTDDEFRAMVSWGFFAEGQAELIDGMVVEKSTHEPHYFTHDELFRMVDEGWFADTRVQLIEGEIIEMPAQMNIHLVAIDMTRDALVAAFGLAYWVRIQGTLNLSPFGVPDPDLAVVPIGYRSAAMANPTSAHLVVEVSHTTLRLDHRKANTYAAGGIQDYWIANLVDRQLEIYRDPRPDAKVRTGFSYATRIILKPGETTSPLAAPNASIAVADLLP
jgi:Uma2 family endonuclease